MQRGIWGFHGDHAPHGDRLLQLGRHVRPARETVLDCAVLSAVRIYLGRTSSRSLTSGNTTGPLSTMRIYFAT